MSRILSECISEMPASFGDGLQGVCVPNAEIAAALGVPRAIVAEELRVRGLHICSGDVVIAGAIAMEVVACVSVGTESLRLLVARFQFHSLDGYGKRWRRLPTLAVFDVAGEFQFPSYWSHISPSELLTI